MVLLDFDSPAAHQPQRRGGRRETNKQADGKRLDNCIEGPSEESLIGHGRRPGVSRLGNAVHLATETFPYAPEGVKEFKTGRDREGEVPAEPPGAKDLLGRWLARRLALPIFSHLPFKEGIDIFHPW